MFGVFFFPCPDTAAVGNSDARIFYFNIYLFFILFYFIFFYIIKITQHDSAISRVLCAARPVEAEK